MADVQQIEAAVGKREVRPARAIGRTVDELARDELCLTESIDDPTATPIRELTAADRASR